MSGIAGAQEISGRWTFISAVGSLTPSTTYCQDQMGPLGERAVTA